MIEREGQRDKWKNRSDRFNMKENARRWEITFMFVCMIKRERGPERTRDKEKIKTEKERERG